MTDIYILLIGIFSGILGTLLGLGGGTFTLPILVFVLKMDIHSAISLSLVSILSKSILSTAINFKEKYINIPLALLLIPPALIGSTIGGRIGLTSSEFFLTLLFSGVLVLASVLIYTQRAPKDFNFVENHSFNGEFVNEGKTIKYTPANFSAGFLISTVGGFFGGILGIGGGGILVPVMKIITKTPMKAATATSLFIMGFASMPPTILYYQKGVLNAEYAVFIILGTFFGALIGNYFIKKIKDKHIAKMFSFVLIIIAISIVWGSLKNRGI